ncbi:hypothetical protein ABNE83_09040 [Paenibacillus larvae]
MIELIKMEAGKLFKNLPGLVIWAAGGSYSYEYAKRMDQLIFSSGTGRRKVFWAKLVALSMYTIAITLASTIWILLAHTSNYGFGGWNSKLIQLDNAFNRRGFYFDLPVWLFILLFAGMIWAGLLALAVFVQCLSSLTKLAWLPFIIGGILYILGAFYEYQYSYDPSKVVQAFSYSALLYLEDFGKIEYSSLAGIPVPLHIWFLLHSLILLILPLGFLSWSWKRKQAY